MPLRCNPIDSWSCTSALHLNRLWAELTCTELKRKHTCWMTAQIVHWLTLPCHCPLILWSPWRVCHGMTSPPSFSISFLFHPLPPPLLHLLLTLSTHPLPPPHQLWGIPMQLCYTHCWTSPGLMSDLLGSGSHTKGYCLYTFVQFVWSFFIGNNGQLPFSWLTPFSALPVCYI